MKSFLGAWKNENLYFLSASYFCLLYFWRICILQQSLKTYVLIPFNHDLNKPEVFYQYILLSLQVQIENFVINSVAEERALRKLHSLFIKCWTTEINFQHTYNMYSYIIKIEYEILHDPNFVFKSFFYFVLLTIFFNC